jgi:hypothetical protein
MIYAFIKKMKRHFRLKRCKVLRKYQRSYYRWKSNQFATENKELSLLKKKITSIYFENKDMEVLE